MAINFNQLASGILSDPIMTVTVVFYPNGEMHDIFYGEIPLADAVRFNADHYRVFTIQVDSTTVERVELEKTKVNIIQEAIQENQP